METTHTSANKILRVLLKDIRESHTASTLAEQVAMTRGGVWKLLKRMNSQGLLVITPIGRGKTSTHTICLNWDNPLTMKSLELLLIAESLGQQRWIDHFSELEKDCRFLILYGSILHSPKEARDIDVLGVVEKDKFIGFQQTMDRLQKSQAKRIHAIAFTEAEFRLELLKPNKAFVDAIFKGVVLFGQGEFIAFMKDMRMTA